MKPKCFPLFAAVRATLLAAVSSTIAFAANGTWTFDGNANWSDTTKWSGAVIADGVNAIADFSSLDLTGNRTITLDSNRTVGTLKFDDTGATGDSGWTLNNSNNAVLTLATGSATAPTISLGSTGVAGTFVQQTINAPLAGTNGFTVTGTNQLVFGASALAGVSGTMTINGGRVAPGTNLGGITSVVVNAGGQLGLFSAGTFNQNFSIAGTGYGEAGFQSALRLVDTGTQTLNGTVTLTGDATLGAGKATAGPGTAIFNGAIQESGGSYALTFGTSNDNKGTYVLNAANTYTGSTNIAFGTVQFAKEVALYNNNQAAWTAQKLIVNSGTTAAFNIGGTGEFTAADIDIIKGLGTASGGFKSGANLGLDTTNASSGNFTYGTAIANTNSGTNTLGLTKLGIGTLTLTGANSYTGGTTINGGNLIFADSGAVPTTGSITVNSNGSLVATGAQTTVQGWLDSGKILNTSTGAVAIAGDSSEAINFTGYNSLGLASSGTATYSGTITTGTGGYRFGCGASTTLTVSSQLTGTNALTKTGASTTILTGINNYSGGTNVSGGVLQIASLANLGGATAPLSITNGGTLRYTGTVAETLSGNITTNSGGGNVDVVDAAAVLTFWRTSGTNNSALTKTGLGTLRYGANGDNSGASAIVNQGVLEAVSSVNNNFANVTVNNGGTFRLGTTDPNNSAITADHQIWNGGSLTVNTGGFFQQNGMNETVSALNINGGSITGAGTLTATGSIAAQSGTMSTKLVGNALTKSTAGTLELSGTGNAFSGQSNINDGTVLISGGSNSATGALVLGNAGTAANTFAMTGGSWAQGGNATYIGNNPSAATGISKMNLSGGAFTSTSDINLGVRRSAELNISGSATVAVVNVTTLWQGSGTTAGSTATLNLDGGTLTANSVNQGGTANGTSFNANLNGGLLKAGAAGTLLNANLTQVNVRNGGALIDTNGNNTTIAAALQHSNISGDNAMDGGLSKSGSGTLTLSAANTYTGGTLVSQGSLRINGSTSASSAFTVSSGASLGGSGTISGAVNVTGVLEPGNSIESLATGALTLGGGSTYQMEVQNTTASGADLTAVTGNLNLTGTVTLDLVKLGAAVWAHNDKLTLIGYTGAWNSGLFTFGGSTVADDSAFTFDGQQWTINYNDMSKGSNFTNDTIGGSFVTMTAIPEPSAALLSGLGLLALLRRRRN